MPDRLFGTDGIRGPFGEPPLDRATVVRLGRALSVLLTRRRRRPAAVLGGDTRASTLQLTRWLAAGLTAGGTRVRFAGVVPTPGVAHLARALDAAAGVAVSASHNPHHDNGIKLFSGHGFKWTPAEEAELEEALAAQPGPGGEEPLPALEPDASLPAAYVEALRGALAGERPLDGLRLAVDAAHGAAAPFAAGLFTRLGADVVATLGDRPDGTNINLGCGSTAPERLAAATVERGADLGVAFDGDADRAIFVDERGAVRDGDAVLYLWARELARAGELEPPRIVATSMSNLGLERALAAEGVGVVRCGVGDRLVVETLQREGLVLGGEQSGHVVHLALSTTGDGLLTALQLAAILRRAGRPLSELLAELRRYPQLLLNVEVASKPELHSLPAVAAAARAVEQRLGEDGRLVLRYSGTEPLARVMIEGPDESEVRLLAEGLAATIREAIGGPGEALR